MTAIRCSALAMVVFALALGSAGATCINCDAGNPGPNTNCCGPISINTGSSTRCLPNGNNCTNPFNNACGSGSGVIAAGSVTWRNANCCEGGASTMPFIIYEYWEDCSTGIIGVPQCTSWAPTCTGNNTFTSTGLSAPSQATGHVVQYNIQAFENCSDTSTCPPSACTTACIATAQSCCLHML